MFFIHGWILQFPEQFLLGAFFILCDDDSIVRQSTQLQEVL